MDLYKNSENVGKSGNFEILSTKLMNTKITTPKPATPGKIRVLLCGTYPIGQSNGYSRVVYHTAKHLGLNGDIELTIYGFQNFRQTGGVSERNDLPPGVKLHDALSTEEPKRNGFGENEIGTFLKNNPQDIVIIFNDMVITSMLTKTIIEQLSIEERRSFKLVSYMDQVYPYQKPQYIQMLNQFFDAIIAFTPYWAKIARQIGIREDMPMYVYPHGFDYKKYYPVDMSICRTFFSLDQEAFLILNLNRNQPRKRWDISMIAYAEVVKRYYDLCESAKKNNKPAPRRIQLVIATAIDGFWDVREVYEHEIKIRGVPFEFAKPLLYSVANPQQLSDRDINVLYNACDIGLNTCEGEGFGLCQIEHAALGHPQVVAKIGGMQDFLNDNHSIVLEAKFRYHIDKNRDGIGGIGEMAAPIDFADGIWRYYSDKELVKLHGENARKYILQHYRWDLLSKHLHSAIQKINVSKKIDTYPVKFV